MARLSWKIILDELVDATRAMRFDPPVRYVYNPLIYARGAHDHYCHRYGRSPKRVVLLGMNPGPFGMVQTGIPFGDREMVRDWLGIGPDIGSNIGEPVDQHPKRPVLGFAGTRSEVSGKRLWGWAQARFGTPQRFFKSFWVANYCPLAFMEESGRNRTPDKLDRSEQIPLFAACDRALARAVALLRPEFVVGVGRFAARRAEQALSDAPVRVGCISHPSPANPIANQGWSRIIEQELAELGVRLSELQLNST